MKKSTTSSFTNSILMIALALGGACIPVCAQSADHVTAKIPFNFMVGDKTLQAGAYTIRLSDVSGPYTLMVRGEDSHSAAIGLTNTIQTNKAAAQTKLVFHKYGDSYFLSEVWVRGDETGRSLPKSRAERERKQELARTDQREETMSVVAIQP